MPEKTSLRVGRCLLPVLLAMLATAASAGGALLPDGAPGGASFVYRAAGTNGAMPARKEKTLIAQARPPVDPKKLEEWKSLPPEAQRDLRRRMDQWRRMSPEFRERYSERFRQWQNLPPEERQNIRNRLEELEKLSPDEKEEIRRKFKKR